MDESKKWNGMLKIYKREFIGSERTYLLTETHNWSSDWHSWVCSFYSCPSLVFTICNVVFPQNNLALQSSGEKPWTWVVFSVYCYFLWFRVRGLTSRNMVLHSFVTLYLILILISSSIDVSIHLHCICTSLLVLSPLPTLSMNASKTFPFWYTNTYVCSHYRYVLVQPHRHRRLNCNHSLLVSNKWWECHYYSARGKQSSCKL